MQEDHEIVERIVPEIVTREVKKEIVKYRDVIKVREEP